MINTPDIIKTHELLLNGYPFYSELPIEFMRVNRFMNNYNDGSYNEMSGIYNFSFSLNNDKYQPSGICNFSVIKKKEMRLKLKELIVTLLVMMTN